MAIDLSLLSEKLVSIREKHALATKEVSAKTGIPSERLLLIESGKTEPTGDEILILSDLFSCDFKYFISNQKHTSLDEADTLFRLIGKELTSEDRLAISQFLFLCENEQYLYNILGKAFSSVPSLPFSVTSERIYKIQGVKGALSFRQSLKYDDLAVVQDVFSLIRSLGVHVFRRRLLNSNISGISILHPDIGHCVLVNYDEDIFRQRFSALHELGHLIFDSDLELIVSSSSGKWSADKLRELRCDNFAATFLCPPTFVKKLGEVSVWKEELVVDYCLKMNVNPVTLAIALSTGRKIDKATHDKIRSIRIPKESKMDSELEGSVGKALERMLHLLGQGLSKHYVKLCFDAYYEGYVSIGKLADMMLLDVDDLEEIASLFNVRLYR
jgi:Zn-dependent peptidase ImmA (M78 family)/transcriptional regulator with XRE-family HTH domain